MQLFSAKFNTIVKILVQNAQKSKFSHACAVISGGKILSLGINNFSREPGHAEINAINNYRRLYGDTLNRCYIFVLRVCKNGFIVNSKPCSYCVKYIQNHGVKRVVYSTGCDSGFIIEKPADLCNSHTTPYFRRL
jgi:deoxycytidylate deaminase